MKNVELICYAKNTLDIVGKSGYTEYVIAGGFVRDLLLEKNPKDIDIFIFDTSDAHLNRIEILREFFRLNGFLESSQRNIQATAYALIRGTYFIYNFTKKNMPDIQIILCDSSSTSIINLIEDFAFNTSKCYMKSDGSICFHSQFTNTLQTGVDKAVNGNYNDVYLNKVLNYFKTIKFLPFKNK